MNSPHILCKRNDVQRYVEEVRRASDANREALGFLPAKVFLDYARREKLLIAVHPKTGEYWGHLLFDQTYPRASVVQIYCEPAHRGQGVARALLDELKQLLTSYGFLSVKARVAQDLQSANVFWEGQRFFVKERRAGGATTGRMILVRVHELDSPQLFPKSGLSVSGSNNLGLKAISSMAMPMYLIDLNVIFDLTRKRVRHDRAVALFQAFYAGECRLAISAEIRLELQRTAKEGGSDPMLALLDALPEVRVGRNAARQDLEIELKRLVFPEKNDSDCTANDRSDASHLATAILCNVTGFITSDGRILDVADRVLQSYGVHVVSPNDFGALDGQGVNSIEVEAGPSSRLEIAPFGSTAYEDVQDLLKRSGVAAQDIASGWLSGDGSGASSNSHLVRSEGKVVGYVSWARLDPAAKELRIKAVVDEMQPQAHQVARILLMEATKASGRTGLVRLVLDLPERQVTIREFAHKIGFRDSEIPRRLLKLAVRGVVTPDTWSKFREKLLSSAGIGLPEHPPVYEGYAQLLRVGCPDGDRRYVRLDELETLLSPVIFYLEGRPSMIIPIRPEFAEPLLGHGPQLSFAPRVNAETSVDRLYLSSARTLGRYERGAIALFYESGGNGAQAIVAAARIADSYLIRRDAICEESLSRSVLTMSSLSDIGASADKAACLFDNVVAFDHPVGLRLLKEIGHNVAHLRTTNKVSNEQATKIFKEGLGNG